MKAVIILLIAALLNFHAVAQDNSATVDVLKAPSSPAANMLGTSPSDVQQFTDPSSFAASIQKASDNFTSVPTNYAIDIAPAWLFFGHKISYVDFMKDGDLRTRDKSLNKYKYLQNMGTTIWQTLVLSAASRVDSSSAQTKLGFGIKFSLLRGHISNDTKKATLQTIDLLEKVHVIVEREKANARATPEYQAAQKKYDADANDTAANAILDNIIEQATTRGENLAKEESGRLKTQVQSLDFKRYGWKIDFAAGLAVDYPSQKFDSAYIMKSGAWITFGYEGEKSGLSALGLLRYLYHPDKIFADDNNVLKQDNLSTFDAGARIIYTPKDSRFNMSAEGIYRSVLQKTNVNPTYRFTINAEYQVGSNQKLTLALGRDYDGTFHKDGNVIAALNLILGFGNNRLNYAKASGDGE